MPEETMELFDEGAFTVFKTRWGTYASTDKEGKGLVSGLDKEAVVFWSREHLTGFPNSYMTTTNVSISGDSIK